jgi:hypothetical protein
LTIKLEKSMRREISVNGLPYIATLSAQGIKLVQKGRRNGVVVTWDKLIASEAALNCALDAALRKAKLHPHLR